MVQMFGPCYYVLFARAIVINVNQLKRKIEQQLRRVPKVTCRKSQYLFLKEIHRTLKSKLNLFLWKCSGVKVLIPYMDLITAHYSHIRSGGVVGYHVCLTRRRSRVRFSARILSFFFFINGFEFGFFGFFACLKGTSVASYLRAD